MNKTICTSRHKHISVLMVIASFTFPSFADSHECATDLVLWFTRPATVWDNSLPVGNGRLGAMVFGGVEKERLQLNEETVWTGNDRDYHNSGSLAALDSVRQLLFEGRYGEAERIAQQKIMSIQNPPALNTYQTLGDLHLFFRETRSYTDYRRELDLETAIARVSYVSNGIRYTREVFSSAPDQVLVLRLSSDREASLSFTARLSRPGNRARIENDGSMITMTEHVGEGNGVCLVARMKILTEGGSMTGTSDSLIIEKASQVTILLTAATDYRGIDPAQESLHQLQAAEKKNYVILKKCHIDDYRQYFQRVDFDLGRTDAVYFTTDARIDAVRNGNYDPQLIELYYQFGRYLLISSSRPGCLPANLQGLWADGLKPPWSADYHININIQMNYWPAEITNLSELHEPFLRFINDLRPDARKTAREMYGCRGIVAHHTTDVWHYTEPSATVRYGMWPMGIAWSCQHLWEHYLFTGDRMYLDTFAYPIMCEAAEFIIDWLVEDPHTGNLVSGPSISPENRYKTRDGTSVSLDMGPTMDQMIIWELLTSTIEAGALLGRDEPFRAKLQEILDKLAPVSIGRDGRLLEWSREYEEAEPGHRHISHLFGLHPGRQITESLNPELMAAARKTIDYRLAHGGGHTGWSRAWIINFFARLRDGDAAYHNLQELLRKSTLHNLFDTHPPFQIDGNFGAVAGITEMLLQSHAGMIDLLPALPSAWQNGHINGICARGGFVVDIEWKNGKLKQVALVSKLGNSCKLRYGEKIITVNTREGEKYYFNHRLKKR